MKRLLLVAVTALLLTGWGPCTRVVRPGQAEHPSHASTANAKRWFALSHPVDGICGAGGISDNTNTATTHIQKHVRQASKHVTRLEYLLKRNLMVKRHLHLGEAPHLRERQPHTPETNPPASRHLPPAPSHQPCPL